MATVLTRAPSSASVRGYEPPVVEIAVPVYNEVATLGRSIARLSAYLQHAFPFSVRVRHEPGKSFRIGLAQCISPGASV